MTIESFIGLLVLACIGAYFFNRNARKARRAIYDTEFRATFSSVISELESPIRTQDVRDILVKEFRTHNIAVTTFRGNINWFSRYRLKKAWQQYHSGHQFDAEDWDIPKKERLFMDCFTLSDKEAVKVYLDRIHKIAGLVL